MQRPGFHTSEFIVTLLNAIAMVVSAAQGYVSDPTAVKLSVGGFLAYIVSRGLAKNEQRGAGVGAP
jgi:hypothetical protein